MIGHLTATDLLLIQAAGAGDLQVRPSRGYDDGKPEGWPVTFYRGRPVATDDDGRLCSLERDGYLNVPDDGPVTVTDAGLEAIR